MMGIRLGVEEGVPVPSPNRTDVRMRWWPDPEGWNVLYEVTEAHYRYATADDEIPAGRVVTVIDEPGVATVVVKPGHASKELLADMTEKNRSMLALGQWLRLAPTDASEADPRRVLEATWQLVAPGELPDGALCMPLEKRGRHVWLIREGEASRQLVREMSDLLTRFVQAGVWIQCWDSSDTT